MDTLSLQDCSDVPEPAPDYKNHLNSYSATGLQALKTGDLVVYSEVDREVGWYLALKGIHSPAN